MIDAVVAKAINDAWQLNKTNLRQSSNPRFVEHNSPLMRHKNEKLKLDYKQLKLSPISSASAHVAEQFKNDHGSPASPSDLETLLTLNYTVEIVGERPTDSGTRPLYIALHGGGGAPTEDNDDEWKRMTTFYKGAIKSGVWVAARGIGDTWDLHFTGAGYVLIERLVENMILFGATDQNHASPVDIDPNRVYLIGFSAGGDGVYRLAPRLAQRFAAVNMGGGHPGSVLASSERPTLLRNLANTPICVQVGEMDSAEMERSQKVAQSAMDLDEVKNHYTNVFHGITSSIFIHDVFIHPTDPDPQQRSDESQQDFKDRLYRHRHNSWEGVNFTWSDPTAARKQQPVIFNYAAWRTGWVGGFPSTAREPVESFTNAIDWLNKYTRTPTPQAIVWDLLRGKDNDQFDDRVFGGLSSHGTQNYWLDISGKDTKDVGDLIEARVDYNTSTIHVTSAEKYLRILLRPEMVQDMSNIRVQIQVGSKPMTTLGPYKLGWSQAIINHTMARNDPNLVFSSDIVLNLINNEWIVTTSSPALPRAML